MRTHVVQLFLTIEMAAVLATCMPSSSSSAPPVAAPPLTPEARAGRGEVVVTLFHETHMHGSLLGQDYQGHPADGRTFANYVGVMDLQRRRLQADSSLFLGNGDDLSDELEIPAILGGGTIHTGGSHVLEAFAAAGMDADTFGFDYLPDRTERLRELVSRSQFPWVSANVRDGSRLDQVFAANEGARLWVLKNVDGIRVGITGVVATGYRVRTNELQQPGLAVTIIDPVKALREIVPRMRAAGAQVVVVLSHLFFDQMEQVAQQVAGINAILGSHQGPPSGYLSVPEVIRGTIISKPGHDIAALGQLDLVVRSRDGVVVRFGFQRHPIAAEGPSSPVVKAILDRYLAAR